MWEGGGGFTRGELNGKYHIVVIGTKLSLAMLDILSEVSWRKGRLVLFNIL